MLAEGVNLKPVSLLGMKKIFFRGNEGRMTLIEYRQYTAENALEREKEGQENECELCDWC